MMTWLSQRPIRPACRPRYPLSAGRHSDHCCARQTRWGQSGARHREVGAALSTGTVYAVWPAPLHDAADYHLEPYFGQCGGPRSPDPGGPAHCRTVPAAPEVSPHGSIHSGGAGWQNLASGVGNGSDHAVAAGGDASHADADGAVTSGLSLSTHIRPDALAQERKGAKRQRSW